MYVLVPKQHSVTFARVFMRAAALPLLRLAKARFLIGSQGRIMRPLPMCCAGCGSFAPFV